MKNAKKYSHDLALIVLARYTADIQDKDKEEAVKELIEDVRTDDGDVVAANVEKAYNLYKSRILKIESDLINVVRREIEKNLDVPTVYLVEEFWDELSNTAIAGKRTGAFLRELFMEHMDNQKFWDNVNSPAIRFDFTGVRKITPSFANDAFAYFTKYANATKVLKVIEFVNITNIKRAIINLEVEQGHYAQTT